MKTRAKLSPELLAELAALNSTPDKDIDLDDMPETTDFRAFGHVDFANPNGSVRPVWIERELIDWFSKHGDHDEPIARRINEALRDFVSRVVRKAA